MSPVRGWAVRSASAPGLFSLNEISSLKTHVSIDQQFESELDPTWLATVARAGLMAAEIDGEAEVSLLITDDDTVSHLNAEYRGLDETTDVLSFSTEHAGHWEGEGDEPGWQAPECEFILPPGLPRPLGEIIVSWPQAQRQAGDHGVEASDELAHLIVHGALHLVGHDHVEREETIQMQALERKALESLSLAIARTIGSSPAA